MKNKSRRNFIIKAALASMGVAILPYCKKSSVKPESENFNKKIIVIGAGISGLATAKTLHDAGFEVIVLEADNRYGGRIHTVDVDGYKADFGASWIHGIDGNPLYSLAGSNSINTKITHPDPSYLFDIDGVEITEAEWQTIEDLLNQLVNLAYDHIDVSLMELLDIFEPELEGLSDKMKRVFYGAVRSEIEIPYAVDANEISAKALTTNDSFPGNDVVFSNGMSQLTDILSQDIDIRYNTFVTKISYSGENVLVYTKSTDNIDPARSCSTCHTSSNAPALEHDNYFTADIVVVALPLAMLKYENVVFDPALPTEKVAAINSLGIGTMNKVFLVFEENFWNSDGYFFQYIKEDYSKIIEFFSPTPTGTKNVIVAVFAGQHAKNIEAMDIASIKEIVMNDLVGMFGPDIPQPVSIEKTAWHTNPFSLGSYPHLLPGSDLSACNIIAAPINDKVFFAGDATSKKYMATAHGAYLSGIKAAVKIINAK